MKVFRERRALAAAALAGSLWGAACGSGTPAGPAPTAAARTSTFDGSVGPGENQTYVLQVGGGGELAATLEWREQAAVLAMDLHVPGAIVASSRPRTGGAELVHPVTPGEYRLQVIHRSGTAAPFTLRVAHP